MGPFGSDTVFKSGEFKGKTYWFVIHRLTERYHWASTLTNKTKALENFVKYVDQYFRVDGTTVIQRDTPIEPPPTVSESTGPKQSAKRCPQILLYGSVQFAWIFLHRGSTAYTFRSTCLDCGHATT